MVIAGAQELELNFSKFRAPVFRLGALMLGLH
jgi:hypothetical protein